MLVRSCHVERHYIGEKTNNICRFAVSTVLVLRGAFKGQAGVLTDRP